MGRLKSNALGSRNRHSPTRDSRDSDGRLIGSLAAFKLAIKPWLKKKQIRFFSESFHAPPDSFISKNKGMAKIGIPNFRSYADLAKAREWYSRAGELGSADASSRLGELSLRRILGDE
jgi:TPR repeat protein